MGRSGSNCQFKWRCGRGEESEDVGKKGRRRHKAGTRGRTAKKPVKSRAFKGCQTRVIDVACRRRKQSRRKNTAGKGGARGRERADSKKTRLSQSRVIERRPTTVLTKTQNTQTQKEPIEDGLYISLKTSQAKGGVQVQVWCRILKDKQWPAQGADQPVIKEQAPANRDPEI